MSNWTNSPMFLQVRTNKIAAWRQPYWQEKLREKYELRGEDIFNKHHGKVLNQLSTTLNLTIKNAEDGTTKYFSVNRIEFKRWLRDEQ